MDRPAAPSSLRPGARVPPAALAQASGDEVLYLRPDALQILQSDNPKSKPISGECPTEVAFECIDASRAASRAACAGATAAATAAVGEAVAAAAAQLCLPRRRHLTPVSPLRPSAAGGIPHCFPQFGPGAMQQHGFARNVDCELPGELVLGPVFDASQGKVAAVGGKLLAFACTHECMQNSPARPSRQKHRHADPRRCREHFHHQRRPAAGRSGP